MRLQKNNYYYISVALFCITFVNPVIFGVSDELLAKGKALYMGPGGCFACHLANGEGIKDVIPPLAGSLWVTEDPQRLIAIAKKGLEGPLKVNGNHYNGSMPEQNLFTNDQLAILLTYVRNSWGNKAAAITAKQISDYLPMDKNDVRSVINRYPFNDHDNKKNGVSNKHEPDAPIHKYKPTVVRTFMPSASPAAIAVALPGGQHYCWDAGECRLRYVWSKGGFITSLKKHWSSNGKPVPVYSGVAWYRGKTKQLDNITINELYGAVETPVYDTSQAQDFPIAIGSKSQGIPVFKGYHLIDNGHPKYWITLNGCDIYECIKITDDHKGIVRSFQIDSKGQVVRIQLTPSTHCKLTASKGKLAEDGLLTLTSKEAKSFKITQEELN